MKTKQEKKQERKMTELKTLKDIFEKSKYRDIIERELKAEAIKRCHYFKQLRIKCISSEDYSYWMGRFDEARIMNNLTKEDLKDD